MLQSCQLILGSVEGENSESGSGLGSAVGVAPRVSRKRATAVKSDVKRKKGKAGEKDIGAGLLRTKSGVDTLPNSCDPDQDSIELKSPTESSLEPIKQTASLPIELSAKTLSKIEAFRHRSGFLESERGPLETVDINLEVSKVAPSNLLIATCCRNLVRVDTISSEFHGDLDDDAFIHGLDEQERTVRENNALHFASQIVTTQDKWLTLTEEEEDWHQRIDNEDFAVQDIAANLTFCSEAVPCRPFIRPAFPALVENPPFIKSLTNRRYLRVCFRIGEAIREGSAGARAGKDVILELYARVRTSSRSANEWAQHFQFGDLYHDHRPYLDGVYKSCHERGSLWERDSAQFLGEAGKGKMARVAGRLKWEQAAYQMKEGWRLTILNIWEADWDDLEHVRGIVDA